MLTLRGFPREIGGTLRGNVFVPRMISGAKCYWLACIGEITALQYDSVSGVLPGYDEVAVSSIWNGSARFCNDGFTCAICPRDEWRGPRSPSYRRCDARPGDG